MVGYLRKVRFELVAIYSFDGSRDSCMRSCTRAGAQFRGQRFDGHRVNETVSADAARHFGHEDSGYGFIAGFQKLLLCDTRYVAQQCQVELLTDYRRDAQ